MIALCLSTALALSPGSPAEESAGHRVAGFGGSHGLQLDEQLVVGGDGGVSVTTLGARLVHRDWTFRAALPLAAYRLPEGRDTDLGNLRLEGLRTLSAPGAVVHAVGLSVHGNPRGTPWTWATRADEVWPGVGADLVWEARTDPSAATTLMSRTSLGLHHSPGFAPVPETWARLGVAGAIDRSLGSHAGLIGELSASYWEIAPVELTGLVRVDPTEGLRLRAGLVLPLFTWLGWDPVDRPSGVREAVVVARLQTRL